MSSNPIQLTYEDPIKRWEVLLMFFLLSITGSPFYNEHSEIILIFALIIPMVYVLQNYNKIITYRTIAIFGFLLGYEVMHALVFKLDYSHTIFKLFFVLIVSFSVANILRERFVKVLVRTMYFISIISFIFTALSYIPGINRFLYQLAIDLFPITPDYNGYYTPTLLVYTFFPGYFDGSWSYVRNAGIFWESGAFAVFLNITLYLHYSCKKIIQINDLFDKESTILILALATCTSTMGFLGLAIALTFFSLKLKSRYKHIFVMLAIVLFPMAFFNLDFLGSKVSSQLSVSSTSNNRFGSALMDWEDIKKSPIIGHSRRLSVLFGVDEKTFENHRPNGLTNFIRGYGFFYFTVYFFLVFQSFKSVALFGDKNKNSTTVALFGVFLLWFVSFSEGIFDRVFLKTLVFLYPVFYVLVAGKNSESKEKNVPNLAVKSQTH